MPAVRRPRRKWIVLAIFVFVLVVAGWWVNRQLEPKRLTALVLEKAGASLGLDLRYQGDPDYAFRPEPRLLIPGLSVRDPGNGKLILSATRADISLPWATITGGEPIITRIALDGPSLDLPALRRWQASQPKTPFKLPTFLHGVHVRNGTIVDARYRITALKLDLPRLHAGEAATTQASGRFSDGATAFDFNTAIMLKTPGLASDFSLKANGSLQHSPKPLAFKLRGDGRYQSDAAGFSVIAPTLVLDGDSPLPRLQGKAKFLLAEPMQLAFDGVLRDWPKDWPSLPAPISAQATDFKLQLSYRGASNFTDPINLHLEKNDTVVDATLRLDDIQDWIAAPTGSPLPPLVATARTPRLEFDGVSLEGVELELRDDDPPANSP
jgi:hypothetical protein